ncbi:uncharacterized protein PHACADRAFT_193834 [Phanerochaete carnosa HHB-10118-sp]|uniref:Retrotransposon Copia-like N-terminal domain-containing protein n=1 Tax=Phanerochaete carnosa (strain HHB-10118-sp) TaxID=650164 RepID=K5V7H2_PHACS|nr:uncharacterized protein PHACADRAFT_193834 [Phanerochaete carnosa HHB-10118-sp]EKM58721.1 hypothetical protein PHACADRAFT_193834 [Phanerochaete carnosa HHB-10118-sp]
MSSASAFASATGPPSMKLDAIGKLKGSSDYPRWSLMMQQYFIAARAWKGVDGTERAPVPSSSVSAADIEAWETTNAYARFYILSTLGDELLHLANPVDITAAALWKKLKDNYAASTTMSAFVKFRAYFSHVITDSDDLAAQLDERAVMHHNYKAAK